MTDITSKIKDFQAHPGVLIAMPQLEDPHFHRAVVLMLEHNEEGALGLILNHPIDHPCAQVTESFSLPWPGPPDARLRRGGPVEAASLWMLHHDRHQFTETRPVVPGVAVSRSRDALRTLCTALEADLHLLVGYSGWAPGQLEQEMASGTWILGRATAELVFSVAPEDLWTHALAELGIHPAHLVESSGDVQ